MGATQAFNGLNSNLSDITYFQYKDMCIFQKKSNMARHAFKISSSKWKGKRFQVLATAGGITASLMAYYFSKGENQLVSADCESVSFLYIAMISVNSFLANVPILYPRKTPENQRFSVVFRGYKMRTVSLLLSIIRKFFSNADRI